ncbi:MAG: cysteine-rich small domain-containing protein [Blautia sp.]|nr:cysteine-rich small domain-containing protein [Lachnoclostridium sp.]MCM1210788.1 cysteine-rich small domain-containing protein [Blautia sp.]
MKNSHRFFENRECQYFPCHKGVDDFNCLFCYCPLYSRENCLGNPHYLERNGKKIKDCTACTFPHHPENYDSVIAALKATEINFQSACRY